MFFFTCVKWCGISHANIKEIFRGPFLNIVTKSRGLTFLNFIGYLVILLDNVGLFSLSQVYITLGKFPSVSIPLNLAYCFFFFLWIIKLYKALWGNTCLHFATEITPISFIVLSGICCLTSLFRFVFTGHQIPMQTHFLAFDICQLRDYN